MRHIVINLYGIFALENKVKLILQNDLKDNSFRDTNTLKIKSNQDTKQPTT